MLLNKRQFDWVSSVFNNLPVISRYFQTCAQRILKKCRQKYVRRHMNIVSYRLKRIRRKKYRIAVIKYNGLKIRGGFGKGRKRRRHRVWKYYRLVFILGKKPRKSSKKLRQTKPKPAAKQQPTKVSSTKPQTPLKPTNNLNISIDPNDDTEFIYYQSSDEETSGIRIVKSSDIELPSFIAANDVVAQAGRSAQPSKSGSTNAMDGKADKAATKHNKKVTNTSSISRGVREPDSESDKDPDEQLRKEGDVTDRLRQQLELLKKGKGDVSLLGSRKSARILFSQQNSRVSSPSESRRSSGPDEKGNKKAAIRTSTSRNASPLKKSFRNNSLTTIDSTVRSTGFIDSLINKLSSTGPVKGTQNDAAKSVQSQKKRFGQNEVFANGHHDLLRTSPKKKPEQSSSKGKANCSSPDFYGFDSVSKSCNVSSLLPTPRGGKEPEKKSAFVSEELDTFMIENALENVKNVPVPFAKHSYDEALLTADAEPPTMKEPHRLATMERPRTLAEKRILFEKKKDIKSLMIENENSIYHALKKRKKEGVSFDNSLLKGIIDGQIPFTRDTWRATCWLNTDHNKFFFQTIKHDGAEIKVFGGRGNFDRKILCEIVSGTKDKKTVSSKIQKQKAIRCSRLCRPIEMVKIRNLDDYMKQLNAPIKMEITEDAIKVELPKRVQMLNDAPRGFIKPGPMCSKVATNRSSVDAEYGPFRTFTLPRVQLEIWPKFEKPLPPTIQPYMKLILPFENITDEWAKFAVSAVKIPETRRRKSRLLLEADEDKSFVFDIPYENDQKKILVRRRRMHSHWEPFPLQDDYSYEFKKAVDPANPLEVECADILSDMITSVAITANENRFMKQDPDIDYVGKVVPIGYKTLPPKLGKPKVSPSAEGAKTTQKNKIM